MASSIIKNSNVLPQILRGQSVVFSGDNKATFPGILTDGSKVVYISLFTGYSLAAVVHATQTITTLQGSLRTIGGYLRNDLANADLTSIADMTVSVVGVNVNSIQIKFAFDSALSSVTNNSPVMFTGTCTVEFS